MTALTVVTVALHAWIVLPAVWMTQAHNAYRRSEDA